MTRVNVVPVSELSDQWLIAEYRELPRCLKQDISLIGAPNKYVLGTGHMKWARKFGLYTSKRMLALISEMKFRGFKTAHVAGLHEFVQPFMEDYIPTVSDLQLNIGRLKERYGSKPYFYTWTRRIKPDYLS